MLILINDDNGWQFGSTFIQDDLEVGHDIYCTTWADLRKASNCNDPNIAKLMDSEISAETEIDDYNVFYIYDPKDL